MRCLTFCGISMNDFLLQKGLTAMHWAAMINSSSVVNRLMRYGATVDIADNEGCTPLWYAACNVQLDCIRRLLSLGASPHRRW